jgi:4,5-DOPA dioxygenase extradiol
MMNLTRREFLIESSIGALGILSVATISKALEGEMKDKGKMPVLFVGHGNPMNGIEDTEFSRAWTEVGKRLPRPQAILCISAHWEDAGTLVATTSKPKMIYDFYGFPDELYKVVYPAPGSPEWAEATRRQVTGAKVGTDAKMGLDHGAWVVLKRMFPKADIPVFQMSLDRAKTPQEHYELGRQLQPLREKGLLIIGSGNMVHNLGLMAWNESAFDWAVKFDGMLTELIKKQDHEALINYPAFGELAKKAIPTNEHYLPMLYTLALQQKDEPLRFFADKVTLGSMSMRSFQIG